MSVEIRLKFSRKAWGNQAVQRTIWNAARFVRDLWVARSPNLGGAYVRALMSSGSIIVRPGEIIVTNRAPHALMYEKGVRRFNWGLRTLALGKNVKTAKDGSRYKIIHVQPQGRVAFRKPSVPRAIIAAFRATIPKGQTVHGAYSSFKDIDRYRPRKSLGRTLKPRKALASAMNGFFVVSEKAIREDPRKWLHEKVEGKHLARDIEAEARPIVQRAIDQAMAAEAARKARVRRKR